MHFKVLKVSPLQNLFHNTCHIFSQGISTCLQQGLPVAQTVKNLPAVQDTWRLSLGWNDPLENGTATHSCILA